MLSSRTLNALQDYIVNWLDYRVIERHFDDNGIRKHFYSKVTDKTSLFKANREAMVVFCSEETQLNFVSEAIEKLYNADDIITPEGRGGTLMKNKLLSQLKNDGYEMVEGKLIPITGVVETISVETAVGIVRRLYADLKNMEPKDPTTLIGQSKDLLESVFKAICDKRGIVYGKDEKFDALARKALRDLTLATKCTEPEKTTDFLRQMIATVSVKINELRNIHGYGHGKNEIYQPLDKASARLIANMALSIATYLLPVLSIKPYL